MHSLVSFAEIISLVVYFFIACVQITDARYWGSASLASNVKRTYAGLRRGVSEIIRKWSIWPKAWPHIGAQERLGAL